MKKLITILLLVAICTAAFAQNKGFRYNESRDVSALRPTEAQKDSASYMLGVNFGMMIYKLKLGDMNYQEIMAGLKDAAEATGDPDDESFPGQFKISLLEMQRILDGYLETMNLYNSARNIDIGDAYAEYYLRNNRHAKRTESGLVYRIIKPGDLKCRALSDEDTVKVNYIGTHIDGTQFDAADNISFTLNRVITGWAEGIKLIGKGGKIELVIPGNLAYGEIGNRGIQPNETLLFVVELLDVEP